ncbi:hypothetical protein [Plantactinospora endophytica]|uniref:Uncharacterized protein n=1 Tax=Plantactinospora endophytica TaxID=673535 RepID=A0ABQ4E4V4_9ACTN|nr:hypothetical protein [Plantactinospora endophytica]GIG89742.1 hypothetical protein Pen02_46780 [Plantactinospora endophytica]
MDELDPNTIRRLDAAFADLRSDALDRVVEPNPDAPRRIAYRRTRNRVTAAGTLAVAVVAGSVIGILGTNGTGPPDPPVASTPSHTAGPETIAPSASPSGSPSATPSGSPSPGASGTPSGTPSPTAPRNTPANPAPTRPDPGQAPEPDEPDRPTDLVLTGPAEVTLTPSNGRYAGTLQIVVRNRGEQPYDANGLTMVEPLEVETRFDDSEFGGCFFTDQDSRTRTSECTGFSRVPSGGSQTSTFAITVDVAPTPGTRTIDGYRLTIRSNLDGRFLTDETPGNNTITVRLRLTGG